MWASARVIGAFPSLDKLFVLGIDGAVMEGVAELRDFRAQDDADAYLMTVGQGTARQHLARFDGSGGRPRLACWLRSMRFDLLNGSGGEKW